MTHRSWFPATLPGERVVLRRHVPANLRVFQRWYADPAVVRLTRYQDSPMRPDEIERFFAARALGSDSLAMAIHLRDDDRLIGTCALSQLDADNGSALFHITIGEKDEWGHGYGTEATRLMIDHAFGGLGLHRVALSVFSFNERAVRSYRSVGFVVEGRAREAIWREGRWWDEISMSLLQSDWKARHERQTADAAIGVEEAPAEPTGVATPVEPATRRGAVMAGILGKRR
ncbi:MAG: GNAT family N-acetyltransferase [Chloroflexi bacterium]|nr:GNAT family N-acetyltransferase [Chloroflexota bacterium]